MKLLAYLIMTACLCLGTLSATVAYSPKLSLADEQLIGLSINGPAGIVGGEAAIDASTVYHDADPTPEGETPPVEPIADKGDTLTPELLASLRDAGTERVRVKEFSIERWDFAWLMGVSCIGLAVAAFMVKIATRKEIREELARPSTHENSPEKSLARTVAEVGSLLADVNAAPDDASRNAMVIDRIGKLQKNELATLADSRTTLVAQLSLSGYAAFMDRFSFFERLLNRAWSAAADGVTAESVLCLNEATAMMHEVTGAMKPSA